MILLFIMSVIVCLLYCTRMSIVPEVVEEGVQTPTPGSPIVPDERSHERAPDSGFSIDTGGVFPSGDTMFPVALTNEEISVPPSDQSNSHGDTVLRCKCGKVTIKVGKYVVTVLGTVLVTIATLYFSGA